MRKYFSVLIPISFLCAGLILATPAEAHGGKVAKADACHNDHKAKNRHKHFEGTSKPEFICVYDEMSGATLFEAIEPDTEALTATIDRLETALEQALRDHANEVRSLEAALADTKAAARDAIDDATAEGEALMAEYEKRIASIRQDEQIAATAREAAETEAAAIIARTEHLAGETLGLANTLLQEAKDREAGVGPPANRLCTEALRSLVIDADTGWFGSDVSVSEDARDALTDVCLSPVR